jgi:hypothetical protein
MCNFSLFAGPHEQLGEAFEERNRIMEKMSKFEFFAEPHREQ